MSEKNFCTIYLVRHGETEWNAKHIIMGQKDSSLTELGLAQATETAYQLRDVNFDAIISSDLPRTKRTAEIIRLDRDIEIMTSHLLRERFYGHFEGKSVADYKQETKELFEKIQKLSEAEKMAAKYSPEMESDEEVVDRFITKLREIAVAAPEKTILVVTHGGPIRTFLWKTGYVTRQILPGGFANAGYVKMISDGVDFIIQEVTGIKENF